MSRKLAAAGSPGRVQFGGTSIQFEQVPGRDAGECVPPGGR